MALTSPGELTQVNRGQCRLRTLLEVCNLQAEFLDITSTLARDRLGLTIGIVPVLKFPLASRYLVSFITAYLLSEQDSTNCQLLYGLINYHLFMASYFETDTQSFFF